MIRLLASALTLLGELALDGAAALKEREARRRNREARNDTARLAWLKECAARRDDDGE